MQATPNSKELVESVFGARESVAHAGVDKISSDRSRKLFDKIEPIISNSYIGYIGKFIVEISLPAEKMGFVFGSVVKELTLSLTNCPL
jgi:hypothetical protein